MPQDIVNDRIALSKIAYVDDQMAERLARHRLKIGDIVFPRRGDIGKRALISDTEAGYLCGTGCLKIVCPTKELDPRFLYLFLSQPDVVSWIEGKAIGATMPNLNTGILRGLEVVYPALTAQREISGRVIAFQNLAENHQQQICKLEEAARLIYTEWFVRLRFPGRKRKSPAWPTRPLKTIADINAESLGKQTHWDTLLYVDISSVSPGLVEQKIEFSLPDAPGRAKRLVAHGDIIWSCVRPNRRSHALILNPEENLIVSTGFATIRPKAMPWTYLYLALTTDAFVAYLESNAQGAAYPAVTGRDFEKAEILLPPPEILEQFDQLTKPIFEQIEALKNQIEKLRQARDLLLPRLISGQLRL